METQIENYIDYLNSVKHASANTIASYRRDLKKMSRFFADRQCTDVRELRGTDLNSMYWIWKVKACPQRRYPEALQV